MQGEGLCNTPPHGMSATKLSKHEAGRPRTEDVAMKGGKEITFEELAISPHVLKALRKEGYVPDQLG